MSQSVAVSTIQSRVCQMCDLPTTLTTTTTVTAACMLDFIKTSCTLLAAVVKEYSDEQLLTSYGTITTTANVAAVTLPNNFSDLIRIAWLKATNEEVLLEQAVSDEWFPMPWSGATNPWSGYGRIRYRLKGANTIEFYPTPDAAYTLNLHYTTGIYVTSTSDTIVCRDGWDQWITLMTCTMVRARQQKDGSEFAGPLAMLDSSIRRQMKRDRYGRKRIRNSRDAPSIDYFGRIRRYPW